MNLQLLFQLLLYEAQSEGVAVETAHEMNFDVVDKRLNIKGARRRYLVTLKTAEEKMRLKKRRPILSGPEALEVIFHVNEMAEARRINLIFHCPTFREVLPKYVQFTDESVSVRFIEVKHLNHHQVHFEGMAYLRTPRHAVTQRVVGEYDSYTQTGWMHPDLFSLPETHAF